MKKLDIHELLTLFAATISREPLAVVDHAPEAAAQPMQSIKNVLQKLKLEGGRALFGWVFLDRESPEYGPYLIAVHHAIWNAAGSSTGIDITPLHKDAKYQPYSPGGKLLFLPDATAQPKVVGGSIAPLASRFFPADDDPNLVAYVEELNNQEQTEYQRFCEGALAAQPGLQRTH